MDRCADCPRRSPKLEVGKWYLGKDGERVKIEAEQLSPAFIRPGYVGHTGFIYTPDGTCVGVPHRCLISECDPPGEEQPVWCVLRINGESPMGGRGLTRRAAEEHAKRFDSEQPEHAPRVVVHERDVERVSAEKRAAWKARRKCDACGSETGGVGGIRELSLCPLCARNYHAHVICGKRDVRKWCAERKAKQEAWRVVAIYSAGHLFVYPVVDEGYSEVDARKKESRFVSDNPQNIYRACHKNDVPRVRREMRAEWELKHLRCSDCGKTFDALIEEEDGRWRCLECDTARDERKSLEREVDAVVREVWQVSEDKRFCEWARKWLGGDRANWKAKEAHLAAPGRLEQCAACAARTFVNPSYTDIHAVIADARLLLGEKKLDKAADFVLGGPSIFDSILPVKPDWADKKAAEMTAYCPCRYVPAETRKRADLAAHLASDLRKIRSDALKRGWIFGREAAAHLVEDQSEAHGALLASSIRALERREES